ncbi:MAG: choice-of-anchor D domain-containing protein, partial [Flavobacterium sp.]|nr:choice-of-anchor D domain-containing protein [Flavobacterium sp.]
SNNRVIYRNTGASVTGITGLTSGTQYTATIYAYNDPNCYNITLPESATFYTLSTEPTAHASSFTCSTASVSQINLNFSAATTVSGNGYIILANINAIPTGVPADGVLYNTGDIIGDATVIGYTTSTATSFVASGLNGGSNYFFTLIPFGANGVIGQTYNYRIAATIPNSNCITVTAPEINVKGVIASNPSIVDGDVTPSSLDNTLFATVVVGNSQSKNFRIENTGNAVLNVTSITFVGGNNTDFIVSGIVLPTTIVAGSFKDFTITYSPSASGVRNTTLTIVNDDSNENPYDFLIQGNATVTALVDINIKGNGQSIPDNSTFPSGVNWTAFPVTLVGSSSVRTFTIENLGTTALNLTGTPIVTISGLQADQFSVTLQPSSNTIAGGSTLTFDVTFAPTSLGAKNATINILSNDPDEGLYNFNISGTAKGTNNIYVYGNSNDVIKGTTTTSLINGTDFGAVAVTGAVQQQTFIITNYSGGAKSVSNVVISGTNATDFAIVSQPSESVSSNGTTSFTISFDPSAIGTRNASINFTTNDLIDPTFTFAISGRGIVYTVCTVGAVQTIAQQDFEPSPASPAWGYNAVSSDATVNHYIQSGTAYGSSSGQNKYIGTSSFQFNPTVSSTGRYSTIYLDPLNVSNYNNVNFSMRVAPFAVTSGQGLDTPDFVSVEVSKDGGVNWSLESVLNGYNNSRFEFLSSGQKIFNTYYTGTNSGVSTSTKALPSCTASCLGTQTSSGANAYSQINLNNLPSISDLRIRITVYCDNTNELWVLDNIKIEGQIPQSTTWSGSVWSAGIPTPTTKAIFDGDYTSNINGGNIEACSCLINSGKKVTISDSNYLESQSEMTVSGNLNIDNNGSLIQVNDEANNIGNIALTRQVSIKKYDYVYWSSPVSEFNIGSISITTPYKIYKWDPIIANLNGGFGNWVEAYTSNMDVGKGFITRAPITFDQFTPSTFIALFNNAKPNNGIITTPISRENTTVSSTGANGISISNLDDNWNLIGNPYPSSIKALDFLNANTNIEGAIRLWTHGSSPSTSNPNPFYSSFYSNYSANDYITYNGTGTVSGPIGFLGNIAAGQGFFILMNDGPKTTELVTFNNTMRSKTYSNSQFYKASQVPQDLNADEKNRIWLDLVDSNNQSSRTLVGYVSGATTSKDRMFDAYTRVGTANSIFTIVDNVNVIIQGRPVPFDDNDQVAIGISTTTGSYSIAIATVDGLFENQNQNIYLEDKQLNIIHDLRLSPYSFTSTTGIIKDRFVLRYNLDTLTTSTYNGIQNNVLVATNNNLISIKSTIDKIKTVIIYNILGREISVKKEVDQNEMTISNITNKNQALLVKIVLENGKVVSKKIFL